MLHRLADASAEIIRPLFRVNATIEDKGDDRFDPVTAADREAERTIRTILTEQLPGHGVIGEEFGCERPEARYQWIIDPIDGTRAFIQGLPTWGTLIGLLDDGAPIAGLMNQPFTNERYWSDGGQAMFRGPDGVTTKITTRRAGLGEAQMATTDPGLFGAGYEEAAFGRLKGQVRNCRYGTDCYAYCLLAAGHIDVVLEAGLKAYDIAPLIAIIEAAGGRVSAWDGGTAAAGGRILACGDARLHSEIIDVLADTA